MQRMSCASSESGDVTTTRALPMTIAIIAIVLIVGVLIVLALREADVESEDTLRGAQHLDHPRDKHTHHAPH